MNSIEAFNIVHDIYNRVYESLFYVYGLNLKNIFIQTLYDVLIGGIENVRKMYSNRVFIGNFLRYAFSRFSKFNIKDHSVLLFGPNNDRRTFMEKKFNIFLDWIFLPEINLRLHNAVFLEYITPSLPRHFKDSYSKNLIFAERIFLRIFLKSRIIRRNIKSVIHKITDRWLYA